MRKVSAETKLLYSLLSSVVLMGAIGIYQILTTAPAMYDLVQSSSLSSTRSPASIGHLGSDLVKEAIPRLAWKFCDLKKQNEKNFSVDGMYVQLKLTRCGKPTKKNSEVVIVNETNGYTASVFNLGTEEFQTDLIQLKEGSNRILIKYANPDGRVYEEKILLSSNQ